MGGNTRIKMKPEVIPHIFNCQPDRKRAFVQSARPTAVQRAKRRIVEEALAPPSTSSTTQNIHVVEESVNLHLESPMIEAGPPTHHKKDVAVQCRPKIRSKSVQCKFNNSVSVGLSPFKFLQAEVGTSPLKTISERIIVPNNPKCESVLDSASFSSINTDSDTCSVSDTSSVYEENLHEEEQRHFQELALQCTIRKLQCRPRLYMGLPDYAFYVFQLLEKHSKLQSKYIFLTLKKIRTGQSFISLADDFGTSEGNASKIFSKSLPIISKLLRKCILTPSRLSVKSNLPIAFRARYSNVFCLIDCLEIEIEKPSDSLKQSLTWSDYKKCNTLKYLISCTPDGIVNFISTGFGGRASDAIIVEHSGFLNILPPNIAIMADRGFKHIQHLIVSKNCILVRPPSVSASTNPTKSEVLETKRIASLRIHVERVIRRLREFSFLAPHACIDNKLIPTTDHVIKIVCGLINLQSGIILGR